LPTLKEPLRPLPCPPGIEVAPESPEARQRNIAARGSHRPIGEQDQPMKSELEARLRKIEESLADRQTVYRFARRRDETECISAEFAGRGEHLVIIRWIEPNETQESAAATST
jgi:hypothetical protein